MIRFRVLCVVFGFVLSITAIETLEDTSISNNVTCICPVKVQEINIVRHEPTSNASDQYTAILNFWKDQENRFHLSDEKDVILAMGNTGSGKSTIISALIGTNLTAIDKGSYFAIIDERGRIGRNSSSTTLVPELIVDKKSSVAYYDCPGFFDNRNIEHEITITYFLKKLMNHIRSVKFLFSVDYASVQDIGNKNDFRYLIKQVTTLIKDIDRYRDGIALVVTKVDNKHITDDDGNSKLANNDTETLIGIANYLNETKLSFQNAQRNMNEFNVASSDIHNEEAIKFIDILLERRNDSFTRIAIFRKPFKAGLINAIPAVRMQIDTIDAVVNENLNYVRKETLDFGYSVSDGSKNIIRNMIDNLAQDRLTVDVSNVTSEIGEYFLQQQQQFCDLELLRNKWFGAFKILSKIDADDPFDFFKKMVNATNDLSVRLSVDTLTKLANDIEVFDFLTTTSEDRLPNAILLMNILQKNIKHLDNSREWYDFLIELEMILSDYNSQNMKDDSRTKTLLQQCSMLNGSDRLNIADIDLKSSLIAINRLSLYGKLEELQVNSFELRDLKTVLVDFSSKIDSSCSSDKLSVSGYNVKLSDVIEIECWSEAKYVEIFALNRIFIDADIDKTNGVRLSIIAPTWEIIGKTKFILNGKQGEAPKEPQARNGVAQSESGRNGTPGSPGSAAGHFLGIGKEFRRAEYLQIQVNGGSGGAGQNGGKGTDGVKGEDVPDLHVSESFSSSEGVQKLFTDKGFEFDHTHGYYRVQGKPGVKPGNGGDGGKGGVGGEAGTVYIVGFSQMPNITISNRTGDEGPTGKGGSGGNATENGRDMKIQLDEHHYVFFSKWYLSEYGRENFTGAVIPAGKNGVDGASEHNVTKVTPKNVFVNPSYVVNSFKNYVRLHLINNNKESTLRSFVTELENHNATKSLYDTLGYINELQGLEGQHFQLGSVSSIPFHESLLQRIELFAESQKHLETRKILNYAYTAVLSKLLAMKRNTKRKTVVNLSEYLKLTENSINEFRRNKQKEIVDHHRDEYKQMFENKIASANEFITEKIQPEIEKISEDIDKKIVALIDEITSNRNKTKDAIAKKENEKKELNKMIKWRTALFPLKLIGSFVSFAGPIGAGVGAAITGATTVAEGFLLDDTTSTGKDKIYSLGPNIKQLMAKVTEQYNNKVTKVEEKLTTVAKDLEKAIVDSTTSQKDKIEISQQIGKIKDEINEIMRNAKSDSKGVAIALRLKQDEMIGLMDRRKTVMEKEKSALDKIDPKNKDKEQQEKELQLERGLRNIATIQSVINMGELAFDFHKKLVNDEAKKELINEEIAGMYGDLKAWDEYEEKFSEIMVPQIRQMEDIVNQITRQANGSSHAELDVTKWKIRGSLTDTKLLLQQMTKEMSFEVQSDLQRCIEKLEEGMSVVIDVFDRIDSYADSEKLAAYISNIGSSAATKITINDPELDSAVTALEIMIHSNLLLEQYGLAVHAFKQHLFPFAYDFLARFELPKNMQLTDTESLTLNAIDQVKSMKANIVDRKSLIGKYHKLVHNKKVFDSNSNPFYVWDSDSIKDQITQLLNGDEIYVKADIVEGLEYNAVKFNEIGIHLKLANETLQSELDAALDVFELTMTIIGNNYYRCGNRFYYISVDQDITISYGLKRDANGRPSNPNYVYDMIYENDFFLSPYAMWTIKLTTDATTNFDRLKAFESEEIDLELIGRGQYVQQDASFTFDICSDQLDAFYSADKTIFNTDSINLNQRKFN